MITEDIAAHGVQQLMKNHNASKVIDCIERWNRVRNFHLLHTTNFNEKNPHLFRNNRISLNIEKWGSSLWKAESEQVVKANTMIWTIFKFLLRVQVRSNLIRSTTTIIHLLPILASVRYSQAWMTMFTDYLSFLYRDTSIFVTLLTSNSFKFSSYGLLLGCLNMIYHKQQVYAAIKLKNIANIASSQLIF